MPGVGEKTAAKLINEYGDLDTLYAHLDALSPKLRQNLADHAERVRINAEVIPLVRDVPLDVDVDDLALGGWDLEEARAGLRRTRAEGGLGPLRVGPAGRAARRLAAERRGPRPAPRAREDATGAPVRGPPGWLERPGVCGPRPTSTTACADLAGPVRHAEPATGQSWPCAPMWEGDPGRSPLLALALVAEAADGRRRTTPAVYLGPPARRPPGGGPPACSTPWPPGSGPTGSAWWPTTPRS